MARREPPKLIGRLNEQEGALQGWTVLVWQLPSGVVRLTAEKAVNEPKRANDREQLEQLPLVDVDGNIV